MNIQELVLLLKGQPISKEASQVVCISARSADKHKLDSLLDHVHKHVVDSDRRGNQKFTRNYFSSLLDEEQGLTNQYIKYLKENQELGGALVVSGLEYLLKYAAAHEILSLFNTWRQLLLKNAIYIFMFEDQLPADELNLIQLHKLLTYKLDIQPDFSLEESSVLVSTPTYSVVDVYKCRPTGQSNSRQLALRVSPETRTIGFEETEENKVTLKETDPDKLVQGTFKIGKSGGGAPTGMRLDRSDMPHLEIIRKAQEKAQEATRSEIQRAMEADEEEGGMDDEDDFDV